MLRTLRIRDYALIDDVELEFREGFNVLTGETGAGKSIVVGALNLVLGARASNETVRDGAKQAKIDAAFYLPQPSSRLQALLEDHGIELEEDELLISRVISAQGRSKAYAAGSLAPVSVLAAIGDELVDLHGQHEHQSLLIPQRQLELLPPSADVFRPFRDSNRKLFIDLLARFFQHLSIRAKNLPRLDEPLRF